ncbi:hypothetical protein IQ268_00640 [Oculatella sp. LEGE 06141]|uniref:hypothetical protein n=1 Tax=Oculatella sp. LEGE 06141 TaxID=1828648 RepID=UPI0018818C20|nr:hypothetical protein [Oculatella sp. LEGE 06141]MBE9177081.1 hypothetical protein [Oculatella sp. LEGE 06141]
MVGFIRGFLRSKSQKQDETTPDAKEPAAKLQKKAAAFFLEPDDAKTFGDIEYMRTTKSIRRTFPKLGNSSEAFETISQVSALQDGNGNLSEQLPVIIESVEPDLKADLSPSGSAQQQEQQKRPETRRADSSMDMFRSMAKEIRKR